MQLDTNGVDRDSVERCEGVMIGVDLTVVVGPAVVRVLTRTAGLRAPSAIGRDRASNGRVNIVYKWIV